MSVEIYHGNHRAVGDALAGERVRAATRSTTSQYLLAGYTCTPLVKFPIADLKAGAKVRGTTIGEFGAGNRVLDMIVHTTGAARNFCSRRTTAAA